jgi:hypothetical protein
MGFMVIRCNGTVFYGTVFGCFLNDIMKWRCYQILKPALDALDDTHTNPHTWTYTLMFCNRYFPIYLFSSFVTSLFLFPSSITNFL